ncbi:hypothetical protein DUI87_28347 [Hirundo rustica rustica]|uniref:RNase H type-1 domain-containing protein n=1 Tax=Hirundo rustica rustica TaxID=333673 RepID=A0A3M0J965_HIRRU|nr:hypothetical protein DUI87_28347 [Hirundo rustica rustica]
MPSDNGPGVKTRSVFNDSIGEPGRRRFCSAVRPAQVEDPTGHPWDIPGRVGSTCSSGSRQELLTTKTPDKKRFLKYQAIMVEQDDVEIVVTNIVNPASFLSMSMGEPVIHDCLEAIEATSSSCPDLKDTLLQNAKTWSTDGSSYVISGRHAGYVVTTSREVIESGPLPTNTNNTSAQKAEITALTQDLELAKGKKVRLKVTSLPQKEAHKKSNLLSGLTMV